jgi:hypothetical protein
MKYEAVRAIAQDGDVFFLHVDKRNILSRLTAWFTKSQLTHAAFLFWYKGRLLVAESTTHGGSRIATASHYKDREFELIKAPRKWEYIVEAALTRSGESGYGWWSAIYIGLRHWMLTHAKTALPNITNNKDKACSEYVAELLGYEDADISPQMLYERLTP